MQTQDVVEGESRPGASTMAVITASDRCFSSINAVRINYFKMLLCITYFYIEQAHSYRKK